jgi:uncharacterized protein involved in copper resistance|tara:strand:- start:753 stop:1157 length:405 start_codon:yes stop_codon:yes gene_type:complete
MFIPMVIKHRRSVWLIALLTLVFLGQSLAVVAMPCQFMDVAPVTHDMASMDHSMMGMHHDMSHMDTQDKTMDMKTTHDCCKTMGHCSSSSCSAPALGYSLAFAVLSDSSVNTNWYYQHIPSSPVSSLYRPPISC